MLQLDASPARPDFAYGRANRQEHHYDLPINPAIAQHMRYTLDLSTNSSYPETSMASYQHSHYAIQPDQATSLPRDPSSSLLQVNRQLHPVPQHMSRPSGLPRIAHSRHPDVEVGIDRALSTGSPLSFDNLDNHDSRQVDTRGNPQPRRSYLNEHESVDYTDTAARESTSSRPSATPSQLSTMRRLLNSDTR